MGGVDFVFTIEFIFSAKGLITHPFYSPPSLPAAGREGTFSG
jgi:hypothetical protein